MDTPPCEDVLLETVATMPQARRRAPETRGIAAAGRDDGPQPQELLAPLPYNGHAMGHEQRMAGITGLGLDARNLDRFPLPGRKSVRETCRVTVIHLNRRMRTRKSGGVGGGS